MEKDRKKTLTISSSLKKKIDTTAINRDGKKSFSVEKKKPFKPNKNFSKNNHINKTSFDSNIKKNNNEIHGDINIETCKIKPLKGSKDYYVKATDEYPILFVIAALTKGLSIFKGIGDLINKESNRIKEMQKILNQIGIKTIYVRNELKIFGKGIINASNKKINVPNLGDHRICMATFILAILTGAITKIKNFETVFTSSPSFLDIMKTLGAKFEVQK